MKININITDFINSKLNKNYWYEKKGDNYTFYDLKGIKSPKTFTTEEILKKFNLTLSE